MLPRFSLAEEFAKKNGATFIDIKDALYGDVNQDGTINSNDYASMKSNVLCQAELDGNAEIIADINNDGVIDAFDISEVSRIINGF